MNANSQADARQTQEKSAYTAPHLEEYGTVAQMTESGATISANDGQTHRARRP